MGAGGALSGGTCGAARGGQAAPVTGGDLHANGALPWACMHTGGGGHLAGRRAGAVAACQNRTGWVVMPGTSGKELAYVHCTADRELHLPCGSSEVARHAMGTPLHTSSKGGSHLQQALQAGRAASFSGVLLEHQGPDGLREGGRHILRRDLDPQRCPQTGRQALMCCMGCRHCLPPSTGC